MSTSEAHFRVEAAIILKHIIKHIMLDVGKQQTLFQGQFKTHLQFNAFSRRRLNFYAGEFKTPQQDIIVKSYFKTKWDVDGVLILLEII